jgi:Icc-related predicted phosphoesterase
MNAHAFVSHIDERSCIYVRYGDGDKGYDAGAKGLLKAIKETQPKISVFGHIHDGWPRAGIAPTPANHGEMIYAALSTYDL